MTICKTSSALAIAAVALFSSVAQAASYDIVAGVGAAPFSYGQIATDGTVTPFVSGGSGFCSANPGITPCFQGAAFAQLVYVTGGEVVMHPDSGIAGNSAIIFTAPTTGNYVFSGSATHSASGGDGSHFGYFLSGAPGAFGDFGSTDGSLNSSISLNLGFSLNAGEKFALIIDSKSGNNGYDSHFVTGTISTAAVPEPASWALMIGGFGLAGGALRGRRARLAA